MKSLTSHWCKPNYQRLISEPIFFKDLIVSDRYIMLQNWFRGPLTQAPRARSQRTRGTLICRASCGAERPTLWGERGAKKDLAIVLLRTWAPSGKNRFFYSPVTGTKRFHFHTLLQCRRKCTLPGNFWQFFFQCELLTTSGTKWALEM